MERDSAPFPILENGDNMNMSVTLFKFSKKFNSTKQPSGGKAVNVIWQSPYSTDEPDIEVRSDDISAGYNYAYIPEFERYYWIQDNRKFRDDTHAVVHLITDVLATYKPYILQQTFFIDKNEKTYNSAYSDGRIACTGNRLVGESKVEMAQLSDTPFAMFYAEIIGLQSNGTFTDRYIFAPNELGAIAAILIDNNFKKEYDNIMAQCFNDENLDRLVSIVNAFMGKSVNKGVAVAESWGDYAGALMNGLLQGSYDLTSALGRSFQEVIMNPKEAIVRILALACDVPTQFETTRQEVYLGQFDAKITGRFLYNALSKLNTIMLDIPWQYKSAEGGIADFRNRAEYTTATLVLPTGDTVALPVNRMYNHSNITLNYKINASTGDVVGYVALGGSGDVIATYAFNIGTPIAVAAKSEVLGTIMTGLAQSIPMLTAGIGSGNAIMGAYALAQTGTNNVINPLLQAAVPTVHGATSQCMILDKNYTLIISSIQTQAPSELNPLGRLLRKPMSLGSLSGFTVCEEAHADVPATYNEQTRLNNFLNTGFYIE